MPIQRVHSKWAKTRALLAVPELQRLIPETQRFERNTVEHMLKHYGMIYVKPVRGTFGNGVIRVELKQGDLPIYAFQSGERKYTFYSFDAMYNKLLQVKRKTPYLAQQGIELTKYKQRKFDLRVMVQKSPDKRWETTGLIGRLAHPRKIVTNYHSGGTPMAVNKLLSSMLSAEQYAQLEQRLRRLGTQVAKAMERKFPRIKEIGIDIALDQQLNPWILEVNTLPDVFLFRKLPDKKIFKRMYKYAVAYGRYSAAKNK